MSTQPGVNRTNIFIHTNWWQSPNIYLHTYIQHSALIIIYIVLSTEFICQVWTVVALSTLSKLLKVVWVMHSQLYTYNLLRKGRHTICTQNYAMGCDRVCPSSIDRDSDQPYINNCKAHTIIYTDIDRHEYTEMIIHSTLSITRVHLPSVNTDSDQPYSKNQKAHIIMYTDIYIICMYMNKQR